MFGLHIKVKREYQNNDGSMRTIKSYEILMETSWERSIKKLIQNMNKLPSTLTHVNLF